MRSQRLDNDQDPTGDDVPEVHATLGIGALSKATGVPVETLRTWERRYGFPRAEREASGQRTYDLPTRQRLLLIKEILQQGLRPARVLPLPMAELMRLVQPGPPRPNADSQEPDNKTLSEQGRPLPNRGEGAETREDRRSDPVRGLNATPTRTQLIIDYWLELVRRFDSAALADELTRAWNHSGTVAFLDDVASPFMTAVGAAWANGELSEVHEHFASEHLRAKLIDVTGPTNAEAPTVVCATLPGEQHSLGLQMAALTLRIAGLRVVYLGTDLPIRGLARTIVELQRIGEVRAMLVSVSLAVEATHSRNQLSQLRSLVPESVLVLAGGGGLPSGVAGIVEPGSLRNLLDWARGQVPG